MSRPVVLSGLVLGFSLASATILLVRHGPPTVRPRPTFRQRAGRTARAAEDRLSEAFRKVTERISESVHAGNGRADRG